MSSLDFAQRALLTLTDASLKALLLLAAAGLFALLARGATARARHLVWALGLGGALLVLPLGAVFPDWTIPGVQLESPFASPAQDPMGGALRVQTVNPARESGPPKGPVTLASDPLPAPLPPPRARVRLPSAEVLLLALWALGFGGTLLWKAVGLTRASHIVARSRQASTPVRALLDQAKRKHALRVPVRVRVSDEIRAPLTLGAGRPAILLPRDASSWSEAELRLALLHELAHVRRGDWLLKQVVHLAVALYWWLPLSWIALRRFDVEQELSCDELVLAEGARPSEYAGLLLGLATRPGRPRFAPLPALDMARRSQMEGRLMAILDPRPRRKSPFLVIPLLLVLAGLVPALALVHPWLIPDQPLAPALIDESEVSSGANRARLAEILRELEAATEGIEAAAGGIEALIEKRMEPIHEQIEVRLEEHLEPYHARIEEIHEAMEPIHAEMEGVLERMEPFHEEIELRALEIQRLVEAGDYDSDELRELERVVRKLELELQPLEDELRAIGALMHPFEERMRAVEVDMAPVEKELEALEFEMAPIEAEIEALEVQLAPFEAKVDALGDELEERLAAELRAMVVAELELAGLDARDESDAIDRVVERVMDRHGVHIEDGALTLGVSIARARSVIHDAFEGRLPAENTDRLAEAFARFEVR